MVCKTRHESNLWRKPAIAVDISAMLKVTIWLFLQNLPQKKTDDFPTKLNLHFRIFSGFPSSLCSISTDGACPWGPISGFPTLVIIILPIETALGKRFQNHEVI